ncbi:hypothetical protein BO82DRAFT_341731 [Aspergillus uvarum CBS 121591]|uniref:Zn(2)-C6 fungal-type domain-containing protein n=1 Tax=Aspergillus uvarum CBS 121591 TaxID=1448315 RepID=A0A319CJE8_9EURO|nr:hypothetical protein BO82DRAFT_341731 [Aspergillus uvarum CBS 121591]PYH78803.1 hypothetical protein BO82DRAFT_341731 [Aspergillus uvarum CBS 121591]
MSSQKRKQKQNSHHGCRRCKQRSVKCDEKRPACSHCIKRQEICHYAASGPWIWTQQSMQIAHASSLKTSAAAASKSDPTLNLHPPDPMTRPANHQDPRLMVSLPPSPPLINTSLHHHPLFLNWTTSTCHSIARTPIDRRIWQTVIPQQALRCPYLLHGLLAISSLHLALQQPISPTQHHHTSSLITAAEHHQSAAITLLMQALPSTTNRKTTTFALSCLLIGFAFAFPLATAKPTSPGHPTIKHNQNHNPNPLDDLLNIFTHIRKMMAFSTPTIPHLRTTEMGDLLHLRLNHNDPNLPPALSQPSHQAITTLLQHLHNSSPTSSNSEEYPIYQTTITHLAHLLAERDDDTPRDLVSASFLWICSLPTGFLDLLRRRRPLALVILAHYCVVLHALRQRWWIAGWGRQVFQTVYDILEGEEEEWRVTLGWACREIEEGGRK